MTGIQNLDTLLSTLDPELANPVYTFATLSTADVPQIASEVGRFREKEGTTVICEKAEAEQATLPHEGAFRMITLRVHSSLNAVGLTAAVSTALAEANIPCNVVAGYHHDHLFVPESLAHVAMKQLRTLAQSHSEKSDQSFNKCQRISQFTLVVPDYDQAIHFYTRDLGFELIEDTKLSATKRWVVVRPAGSDCSLLLAKAKNDQEAAAIGNQTGGRVFIFLETDDFWRDYESWKQKGVRFNETPREETYGTVVVMEDPFGNKWDLIQRSAAL